MIRVAQIRKLCSSASPAHLPSLHHSCLIKRLVDNFGGKKQGRKFLSPSMVSGSCVIKSKNLLPERLR